MDFGKTAFQSRNVSLKSRFVEPTKHLVEFLPKNQTDHRQRKLSKFNPLSQDATEDFRGLNIGEVASCDFQFQADEIIWAIKCERSESADVVNRDRLIRLITANRIGQFPFENSDLDRRNIIVLHERCRPKDSCREAKLADVVLDFPLGFPMGDPGVPFRSAD